MFEKLLSPLEIGPVVIKNRIQVTPHETLFFSDGLVTQTLIDYYAERARNGVGLLEVARVDVEVSPMSVIPQLPEWEYDSSKRNPMVSKPEIVPGLRDLADTVHEYGSKIFMEVSAETFFYGLISAMPFASGLTLRELTPSDFDVIKEAFLRATKYVKDAGFDGVDLHGSHGSLIQQSYSPATNRRNDEYGGSVENRLRFLIELIDAVRRNIGAEMALGMRLCADEKTEHGITPQYAAMMVEKLDGRLDFINVDSGSYGQYEAMNQDSHQTPSLYTSTGCGVYMSEAVRKVARKTKIGIAGRITDPVLAETILRKDQADYVGMTRALIADPELAKKALEGRIEDIRPCIGTLQGCWGRSVAHQWPLRCTVNPTVGRERESALKIAPQKKKVLVIGAGPAGLEAARVASQRGHNVVIYEKSLVLGGQVNLAKKLPGRSDIGAIIAWYATQLRNNGVRVKFNMEVTSKAEADFLVESESADVVILATGSSPIRTGLQMITCREVAGWEGENVHVIDEFLVSDEPIFGKVLVADSTTFVEGPGIAEWLSKRGANVTLVTPHSHVAPELSNYNQSVEVTRRLSDANVRLIVYSWIKTITQSNVVVYDIPSGRQEVIDADLVILNTGRQQRIGLKGFFNELVKEVYEIGDCNVAGGRIDRAIADAYDLASSI